MNDYQKSADLINENLLKVNLEEKNLLFKQNSQRMAEESKISDAMSPGRKKISYNNKMNISNKMNKTICY